MIEKQTQNNHPVGMHEDVQAIFQEYSVTIPEYLAFEKGVFFPINGDLPDELTDPVYSESEHFDLEPGETAQDIWANEKNEFIDSTLKHLLEARQKTVSDFIRDTAMAEDKVRFTTELTALGIDCDTTSLFLYHFAHEAATVIADSKDNAAKIALVLAGSIALTNNPKEYNDWYTMMLYHMGMSLYGNFNALERTDGRKTPYDREGAVAINSYMEELLITTLQSNPDVWDAYTQIVNPEIAIQAAEWFCEKIDDFEAEDHEYYDVTEVQQELLDALDTSDVSWVELMYSLGKSILPTYPPLYFSFSWFTRILQERIQQIHDEKSHPCTEAFLKCARDLGYGEEAIGFLSQWDEKTLDQILHKRSSLLIDNEWLATQRSVNLPFVLTHAKEKAYIYKTLAITRSGTQFQQASKQALQLISSDTMEEIFSRAATDIEYARNMILEAYEQFTKGSQSNNEEY